MALVLCNELYDHFGFPMKSELILLRYGVYFYYFLKNKNATDFERKREMRETLIWLPQWGWNPQSGYML